MCQFSLCCPEGHRVLAERHHRNRQGQTNPRVQRDQKGGQKIHQLMQALNRHIFFFFFWGFENLNLGAKMLLLVWTGQVMTVLLPLDFHRQASVSQLSTRGCPCGLTAADSTSIRADYSRSTTTLKEALPRPTQISFATFCRLPLRNRKYYVTKKGTLCILLRLAP